MNADTVRRRVLRWLRHLGNVYKREILVEEGYPLGLIWSSTEDVALEDIPDAPGVMVTALANRSIRSVVPAISLRMRFALPRKADAALIAFIETGDYESAKWLSARLREEVGLTGSVPIKTNGL